MTSISITLTFWHLFTFYIAFWMDVHNKWMIKSSIKPSYGHKIFDTICFCLLQKNSRCQFSPKPHSNRFHLGGVLLWLFMFKILKCHHCLEVLPRLYLLLLREKTAAYIGQRMESTHYESSSIELSVRINIELEII